MDLLTTNQVAKELGLHPQTVRKWLRLKKLPGFPINEDASQYGRRYRTNRLDLETFVRSTSQASR